MIVWEHLLDTILVDNEHRYQLIFWLVYKYENDFKSEIHQLRAEPFESLKDLVSYAQGYFNFDYVDSLREEKPVRMLAVAPISRIPQSYDGELYFLNSKPEEIPNGENNLANK